MHRCNGPASFAEDAASAAKIVLGEWNTGTLSCKNVSSCGQYLGNTYGTRRSAVSQRSWERSSATATALERLCRYLHHADRSQQRKRRSIISTPTQRPARITNLRPWI